MEACEAGPPYFSYGGAYTVNTTTPTLRDTFADADADADKVNGTFQIYDNATNTQNRIRARTRMPKNLAELAHAALTAVRTPGAADSHAVPTHLDSTTEAAVADTCIRDGLGFVLLFHRRKDGYFAEELYFSTRLDDGSWTTADHLSGGAMRIEPTSTRDLAGILNGRSLALFGESETELFTGRPQVDDGYEMLRFYELLVDKEASHLDIENTPPEADRRRSRIHKSLISQVALFAIFPGERPRRR